MQIAQGMYIFVENINKIANDVTCVLDFEKQICYNNLVSW